MEAGFGLILLSLLVCLNFGDEESDNSYKSSSSEKPFTLERNGRVLTVVDNLTQNKTRLEFDTSEEANRWEFDENRYLENPNGPDPRRQYNLHRY